MKIKKGDTVYIKTGKNKGKTAKVLRVIPKEKKLVVEGVNMYKKHVRPRRESEKGEMIEVTRPISGANAVLICPSCGKRTRVGFVRGEEGKRRVCKKCKREFGPGD